MDLGFRVLEESEDGLLPATVDHTLQISGRHGLYDFGAELGAKVFTFKCAFVSDGTNYDAPSAAELQRRIRSLATHLLDSYGRPKTVNLIRDIEPNLTYRVRLSGDADLQRIIYGSAGFFTLPLVAFDPFARGPEEIEEFHITDSPQQLTLQSYGNVRTEPVIVLRNVGDNPIHGFTITNEYILE